MHSHLSRRDPAFLTAATFVLTFATGATARSAPSAPQPSGRTVVAAVAIDRDQAQLLAFTVKDRPYVAAAAPDGSGLSLSIAMRVAGERQELGLQLVPGVCLEHAPEAEPHIEGDLIQVHRDSLLVELPELAGLEGLEIAYGGDATSLAPRADFLPLEPARFTPAGGELAYADLAFADPRASASAPEPETAGAVHWPSEYGDSEVYRLWGNLAERNSRINVVIVPDGYVYAEKALMQAHAEALVNSFRATTPYAEHDRYFNYTLVYAYSTQSGTDQCDCSVVADTAMNTRFPNRDGCNGWGNRCLYYGTTNGGTSCDPNVSDLNITAAELRAPAKDYTIVMVNTARFGGCGGSRTVYSAANPDGPTVALHEISHGLAGLNDEYGGFASCGTTSGYNTSTNATSGAWPEWTAQLGAPRVGGHFYDSCVYRPVENCAMRLLGSAFCPVCVQRWGLVIFGHARVAPTAPVVSSSPAASLRVNEGSAVNFSVTTRLSNHPAVTSQRTWTVQAPSGSPVVVASGTDTLTRAFLTRGIYTVRCEVVADANLIKPSRYGANVDRITWTVDVRRASGRGRTAGHGNRGHTSGGNGNGNGGNP